MEITAHIKEVDISEHFAMFFVEELKLSTEKLGFTKEIKNITPIFWMNAIAVFRIPVINWGCF